MGTFYVCLLVTHVSPCPPELNTLLEYSLNILDTHYSIPNIRTAHSVTPYQTNIDEGKRASDEHLQHTNSIHNGTGRTTGQYRRPFNLSEMSDRHHKCFIPEHANRALKRRLFSFATLLLYMVRKVPG